ncbi:phage tail protein [Pantoea sp. LMR881]|uniref:phage tail protein n=1 Tax=Pantoea sp. LMR881 TaxID=3014336 RepID=UPI0022B02A42|nr:phage tail protein [Pantoea sp. LMR881]MCZ4061242.1 phage tail protein [Pantoea sp. LMR881]
MEENWFKKRLIPAKQTSELWTGLADAMQSLLESAVLPLIQRTANRKSLFSMDSEDLTTRISELGRFFYINESSGSSLPVLLQQRLDEIHFKGTDRPIESTLWREFKNLAAEWAPLYAPVDQERFPYGTYFVTADELEAAKPKYGDFFLTSRGRINVALNAVYDTFSDVNPEDVLNEFVSQFKLVVEPLIPLTIVFDGMGYHLAYEITERQITFTLAAVTTEIRDGTWYFPPQKSTITLTGFNTAQRVEGTVADINRPLETPVFRLDNHRIDSWGLDQIAAPQIRPQAAQPDGRLIVADGVATLQTLGFRGCVVEFTDGTIDGFNFPDGSTSVILPITAILAQNIKSILFRDTY